MPHCFATVKILCLTLGLLCFAGCVLPPDVDEAQVLSDKDLKLVSLLRRGKDYVAAGRMDLAEIEFRQAVRLAPELPSAYNDLGYVLQAQVRLEESEQVLRKAVELAPNNIVARDNLSRTLYIAGKSEEAAREFELLLETYSRLTPYEIKRLSGQDYSLQDLGKVYRSLAGAYFRAGALDEALCNSQRAATVSGEISQAAQHARLLLTLGYLDRAAEYLRNLVSVYQDLSTPDLLLDYGISLYATKQFDLARDAFLRVLASPKVDGLQRRTAQLFRIVLARRSQNSNEVEELQSALFTDDPAFCKSDVVDPTGYWPGVAVADVRELVTRLCSEDS